MSLCFGESLLRLTHPPLHIYVYTAMCCYFEVRWRHRTRLPQHQSVQLLHPRHQRLVKRHCPHAPCVQQHCQICGSRGRKEERYGTTPPSTLPSSALIFFPLSCLLRARHLSFRYFYHGHFVLYHYFALDVLTPSSQHCPVLHCLSLTAFFRLHRCVPRALAR